MCPTRSPSACTDGIDLAEDRERFQQLLHKLEIAQPINAIARSRDEAFAGAHAVGYPIVIRPSYVLGGRAMEIIRDDEQLERYVNTAVQVSGDSPVLIDQYLSRATEVDVDAICDGKDVFVAGVMEHIEEAGVHSSHSATPPISARVPTPGQASAAISSAICTAFSAAPLRRLSLDKNSASPCSTVSSRRMRPT